MNVNTLGYLLIGIVLAKADIGVTDWQFWMVYIGVVWIHYWTWRKTTNDFTSLYRDWKR